MARAVDLVIFDCDGVLVDSEVLAIAVLRETLAARGTDIPLAEAYRDFLGRSLSSVAATLHERYGHELTEADTAVLRAALFDRYRVHLQPMAGIASTLKRLGHKVCVASSSQLERIRLSLEVTGLLDAFGPHVFSATMVRRGKPAPDLFLHAASAMQAEPGRCLVIEDSPAGIRAAQAAGMAVFAFTGGSHIGPAGLLGTIEKLGPDILFDDMQSLPDLLSSWEMRRTGG